MCPHRVTVARCSGDLTSAQRLTFRGHYIVGTVRGSRRWIRSASVRTEVKDVLTRAVRSTIPRLERSRNPLIPSGSLDNLQANLPAGPQAPPPGDEVFRIGLIGPDQPPRDTLSCFVRVLSVAFF
jgi:hypothetical protein